MGLKFRERKTENGKSEIQKFAGFYAEAGRGHERILAGMTVDSSFAFPQTNLIKYFNKRK